MIGKAYMYSKANCRDYTEMNLVGIAQHDALLPNVLIPV